MRKIIFLLMISPLWLAAQNLTFSKPAIFNQGVKSDKAVSLIKFRENFCIAWKEPGVNANINVGYGGTNLLPNSILNRISLLNCQSSFAPSLCTSDNNLYLFWIDNKSNLRYITTADTTFSKATAHTLTINEKADFQKEYQHAVQPAKLLSRHTLPQKMKFLLPWQALILMAL